VEAKAEAGLLKQRRAELDAKVSEAASALQEAETRGRRAESSTVLQGGARGHEGRQHCSAALQAEAEADTRRSHASAASKEAFQAALEADALEREAAGETLQGAFRGWAIRHYDVAGETPAMARQMAQSLSQVCSPRRP